MFVVVVVVVVVYNSDNRSTDRYNTSPNTPLDSWKDHLASKWLRGVRKCGTGTT